MLDPDVQIKNTRDKAKNFAIDARAKSNERILEDIHFHANDELTQNSTKQISVTIAHFSALLVNLSEQSDQSTQKVITLTKQLVYLTYSIVALTVVLVFFEVAPLIKNQMYPNDNNNNNTQTQNQTNRPKQSDVVRPSAKK